MFRSWSVWPGHYRTWTFVNLASWILILDNAVFNYSASVDNAPQRRGKGNFWHTVEQNLNLKPQSMKFGCCSGMKKISLPYFIIFYKYELILSQHFKISRLLFFSALLDCLDEINGEQHETKTPSLIPLIKLMKHVHAPCKAAICMWAVRAGSDSRLMICCHLMEMNIELVGEFVFLTVWPRKIIVAIVC